MVNEKQKYPTNKRRYDRNYLRAHGQVCPDCMGAGLDKIFTNPVTCKKCDGLGYVEKEKNGTTFTD